jgi:hypothetical protein
MLPSPKPNQPNIFCVALAKQSWYKLEYWDNGMVDKKWNVGIMEYWVIQ